MDDDLPPEASVKGGKDKTSNDHSTNKGDNHRERNVKPPQRPERKKAKNTRTKILGLCGDFVGILFLWACLLESHNIYSLVSYFVALFIAYGAACYLIFENVKRFRWVFSVLIFVALNLLTSGILWKNSRPPILEPPQFNIVNSSILQNPNDGSLSLASIQNRLLRRLEIENPNRFPISIRFITQFPESILNITSPFVSEAEPNWDKHPVKVVGNVSNSLIMEPFATNEPTGLWRVRIDSIPAKKVIAVDFVTAIRADGGFFSESFSQRTNHQNEEIWFILGEYGFSDKATETATPILVPLKFSKQDRVLIAGAAVLKTAARTNLTFIHHGQGFRIPGIFRTIGFIVIKNPSAGTLEFGCESALETTNNIAEAFLGLAGTNLEPTVFLQTKDGTAINVGNINQ